MDKDTLRKAKELESDIEGIERILKEYEEQHHWIQVATPRIGDRQSKKFQEDLAEWLKQKKEKYEKELAEL